jgi:cell division protein FtsI/penicillin-binding protein 2
MFSWFAGFAPSDKPEIAVVVLLADDVTWTKKGNEVARDVLKRWFERRD